jgi:hypothetical protein
MVIMSGFMQAATGMQIVSSRQVGPVLADPLRSGEAMTAIQAPAIVQAAERNMRPIRALAVVQQDLAGRQLSTLRNTYPAWDIHCEWDAVGQVWWRTAKLRRPVTPDKAEAGVRPTVRQPDAIALASALAWQSHLIHSRGRSGIGQPR